MYWAEEKSIFKGCEGEMKGKGVSESMLDVENPVLKSSAYCLLLLASSGENYSEGEGGDEKKKKKTFGFPSCYLLHI